jgi:MFS family permease
VLFVGSQVGAVASRLFGGRLADRYGHRAVLAPAMVGVAVMLAATSGVSGLPAFLVLAAGFGALFGVSFVVLPTVAGEAAPPEGRSAAINTFGLGSDVAQLVGPWGLGLAAGAWGIQGALVVAAAVSLVGAVVYLVVPSPRGGDARATIEAHGRRRREPRARPRAWAPSSPRR